MTAHHNGDSLYHIVLRGDCETLLASVARPTQIEACACGHTCAVVPVRDESEFWGLLDRIQDFALHVVGLTELIGSAWGCGCQQAPRSAQGAPGTGSAREPGQGAAPDPVR